MYNLHLSPEQLEFRDTVRDFVEDEVKPVTLKADRLDLSDRTLPVEVLRKASQMGLRTLALPEDLGGVGADALTCCIVTEELAVGDTDMAAVLAETSSLGLRLFSAMTAEQRARFGEAFLDDDDYHLALACREPGDDSSLGINYHRPAPRCGSPPPRPATVIIGSSTVPRIASPTPRSPSCSRSRRRPTRARRSCCCRGTLPVSPSPIVRAALVSRLVGRDRPEGL